MNAWAEKLKNHLRPVERVDPPAGYRMVASVIVPIGFRNETARDEILMTKRSQWVQSHKSQVSFPGGNYQDTDAGLLGTALRETEEEIGVLSPSLEILGMLEPVTTLKDVLIFPWVARIQFPECYQLNDQEVSRLIFLPLARLCQEGLNAVKVKVDHNGREVQVSSIGISVDNELIWGASARMLEQICAILAK